MMVVGSLFHRIRTLSSACGVLLASLTLLTYAYVAAHPLDEGGYPGGGSQPPEPGTKEDLTGPDLYQEMTALTAVTQFCANAQYGCPPCIVNDNEWSLGGGRINPLGQISPNSGGAGGGPADSSVLKSLSNGGGGGGGRGGGGGGQFWGAPSQSYVNTASFNHNHVAKDFGMPVVSGGMPGGGGGRGGGGLGDKGPYSNFGPSSEDETCSECDTDGDAPSPENNVPYISGAREFRGRDQSETSSYGPGWFSPYDMKLHLNSDEIGDIDVFDPADAAPRRFKSTYWEQVWDESTQSWYAQEVNDGDDGVYEREANGVIPKLTLQDAAGNPVGTRANATKATVENWAGNQFEFEVFMLEAVAGEGGGGSGGQSGNCGPEPQLEDHPDEEMWYMAWSAWYECEYGGSYGGGGGSGGGGGEPVDNDLYEARLTKIRNRDGNELTITYKTWTQAEIDASPERQWQIDTVTDPLGQSISFQYGTTQVGGRWVVEQIDLPGQQSVTFEYANGKLSKVTRPDGSESTFSATLDSTIQHVVMDFNDPAAIEAADRNKEVWTTASFV